MQTKVFSSYKGPRFDQPDLIEIQLNSYKWFVKEGLRELFEEISPIVDHTGKELELYFLEHKFDEPKYTEFQAKEKDLTYEASLRVKVKLVNKVTKDTSVQECYLGDFPVMTDRGTFIVNGVERVVVSQIVRSPGVYFSINLFKGKSLFGAKIIPNRGIWLEFETEPGGFIGVRIDRKRKAPVTQLLRIFGFESNEEIIERFKDVDVGKVKFIETTLSKDEAKNKEESFLGIHQRQRPGDLTTAENAKSLIEAMFFRFDRYDLSKVGRFKFNERMGLEKGEGGGLLTKEDITAVVRELIRLNLSPDSKPDDIDHLGNRRVRAVGELVQSRLRVGFSRLRRGVQDRMSMLERKDLQPTQLVNYKLLTSVVRDFFASSQLSQFMDQVNPLAELEHKRRLSSMGPGGLTRERAGFEVRDVHESYYGRICPIQTPEGANIGLVNSLSNYARVNELGFLETPYFKVRGGRITSEIAWLSATEDEKYNIASSDINILSDGSIAEKLVDARIKGEPGRVEREKIDFVDVFPNQLVSVSTSLIPFLEHDDANRALMGSNMQRQAVPSVIPTPPLVGTGQEEKAACDSRQVIVSDAEGTVTSVDADEIIVKTSKEIKRYKLRKFERSNKSTCVTQRPLVKVGEKVKPGTILADGPSTKDGVLSLGQNLLVAFIPWRGANFEDAIVISEKVARDDLFTSIHIETFECNVRDTKLGPEITTMDIPNVSEDKLRNLDEEGIVRIGAEVRAGDILVGKISPKGESELSSEEKLLRAIFGEKARDVKDASLVLPHGKRGRVIGIKIFLRDKGDKLDPGIIKKVVIRVAQLREVKAGDKLAGRHGNKGVISQIRPVEDMPYLEDGTPIDIVLNPLGVISRMNLGQILETHLGLAANKLGYRAVVPNFVGMSEKEIAGELERAGFPQNGKIALYDGITGEKFEKPVTVGYIYVLKLEHLVEDKIHARSTGPYSLITQQPLGGKAQLGGQRFGEMEVWALYGYGAAYALQEILTIKSDDVQGRSAAFEAIVRGEEIKKPNVPVSFKVLTSELKSLALSVNYEYEDDDKELRQISIKVASPEEILSWSWGEVLKPETLNYRTQRPEKDGLFSERIFGPTKDYECYCGKYKKVRYKGMVCEKCGVEVTRSNVRRERMGHINLATPVAHIWFLRTIPSKLSLILDVSVPRLERVIYYVSYIVVSVNEENRKRAQSELKQEKRKVKSENIEWFSETISNLRPGAILSEAEYLALAEVFGDVFEAGRGAESVRKILEQTDLGKAIKELTKELESTKDENRKRRILRRLKLMKGMLKAGVRPEWMILTVLPVLPPELRPMVALDGGKYATADLNDLYRRVINRNNRLKKLIELKSPEVIITNEKRMLQEAVDALIDNSVRSGSQILSSRRRPLKSLADMLKGKQGRFRGNLLGKRVDYSGRSVIVVGPELKIDECGLPKILALELFRHFVINKIIKKGLAHNIKQANRFIEQGHDEVWEILEEVIKHKRVLLNRAPTLHRLGIQAFKPLLIEDLAIRIPPLVCSAFNADFDGDQMAVHLPLTTEAQYEASELMDARRNLLKPASGDPITNPTQDMVLGIYYLTEILPGLKGEGKTFVDANEAVLAWEFGVIELKAKIKLNLNDKIIETSCGRIIMNSVLPDDFEFVNEHLDKKKLSALVATRLIEQYGVENAGVYLDAIKNLGFTYSTKSATTIGMTDATQIEEKKRIVEEAELAVSKVEDQFEEGLLTEPERRERTLEIWHDTRNKVAELVRKSLNPENPIFVIINSGARAEWVTGNQLIGMRGVVANPQNQLIELPIKSSYKEGLKVLEYFISTHGARKGTTDTALKTAHAGYLTRRLVDVAQSVLVTERDCKTKEGVTISKESSEVTGLNFGKRIYSRVALEDVKDGRKTIVKAGEIITRVAAQEIQDSNIQEISVRSPVRCKTYHGICQTCYGWDLTKEKEVEIGEAVGVIAAQSIGEPGTQLTMRTFHVGGVAGTDITHGLPRVEEIFEARPPKNKTPLVKLDGTVIEIEKRGLVNIFRVRRELEGKTKKSKMIDEYLVPAGIGFLVKEGDKVKKGQQFSEGPLDLREILEYRGLRAAEEYIVSEVQKVYASEGSTIHDKHVETIVRQMLSRLVVVNAGDSELMPGDLVQKTELEKINKDLRKSGKKTIKGEQKILGIARVALDSPSFLSAASFQETNRVLVNAAVEGKADDLEGLKENVIIGKIIPAGTGKRGFDEQKLKEMRELFFSEEDAIM